MHRKLEITHQVEGKFNSFCEMINSKIWTLLLLIFIAFVLTTRNIELTKFLIYCLYLLIFTLCIAPDLKIIFYAISFTIPFIGFLVIMFIPHLVNLHCVENCLIFNIDIDKNSGKHLLQVAYKVFLCTFNLLVYVNSLPRTRIIESLQWLGIPKIITQIMSITMVYFDIFMKELSKMKMAMKLRLFQKGTFLLYWKLLASSIGILFIRSYRKITSLYYSLKLRGYKGRIYIYNSMPLNTGDLVFFCVMVAMLSFIKASVIVYY